ncbi:MAG: peptide chain release factor-like protein [Myxococcota bacterium]
MSDVFVQITAGLAPEPALRFAERLAEKIAADFADAAAVKRHATGRSLVRLELRGVGDDALPWLRALEGTHVLHEAARGRGQRKRWFVGVLVWKRPALDPSETISEGDVRFERCRAGGPGGQHVNRTASAVRAVHVPSGLSVRVQSSRSQQQNKREALRLLRHKYAEKLREDVRGLSKVKRRNGFAFERGNAVCAYVMRRGRLIRREGK